MDQYLDDQLLFDSLLKTEISLSQYEFLLQFVCSHLLYCGTAVKIGKIN